MLLFIVDSEWQWHQQRHANLYRTPDR